MAPEADDRKKVGRSNDGLPSELLTSELAHYRERWRATERIVDQRLTMLIAVLGSAIAATVALLSRNATTSPTVDADALLGAVWLAVAIISEGIFLRLVRARATICRNIASINALRVAVATSARPDDRRVLNRVYELDSRLPRAFYVWGSITASALVQGSAIILVIWFLGPGITEPAPSAGIALGLVAFGANISGYYYRSRNLAYLILEDLPDGKVPPARKK